MTCSLFALVECQARVSDLVVVGDKFQVISTVSEELVPQEGARHRRRIVIDLEAWIRLLSDVSSRNDDRV